MLYHGSKTAGIEVVKPFPHNGVDGESVVFATSDSRFALAMIHGTGNQLAVGYFTDRESRKEEMYIDELVPGAFMLLEEPGILYTLEDTGFVSDPRLGHRELISKCETPVISESPHSNILTELKKHDIRFVSYENVPIEMEKRGRDPKKAVISYKPDRFPQS